MPDTKLKWRDFSGGLFLDTAEDEVPSGRLLIARNLSRESEGPARCRKGAGSDTSVAVAGLKSLHYFNGAWAALDGSGNLYYSAGLLETIASNQYILSGLTNARLSFTEGEPTAGAPPHLFLTDGATLKKLDGEKVYPDGTELITNGTFESAGSWSDVGTPSTGERSTDTAVSGDYSWKFIPDAADEGVESATFTVTANKLYYVSLYVQMTAANALEVYMVDGNGDNPSTFHKTYTAGELDADEWHHIEFTAYMPSGGASAKIVITSGDSTSGTYYVDDVTVQLCAAVSNVGITAPTEVPTAATGAAGNLTGNYAYRVTYKNSYTGTRSNGSPIPSGTGGTTGYLELLANFNGSDADTGPWTSSDPNSHTITAVNDAQLDTAQKKFGTASLLLDGTGDYVTVADDAVFDLGSKVFSLDFWIRIATLPSTYSSFGLLSQSASTSHFWYFRFDRLAGSNYVLAFGNTKSGSLLHIQKNWATPVVDTWYHIALVRGWDNVLNKWAICVDGTPLGTETNAWTMTNPGAAIHIGRWVNAGGTAYYFNGWIDAVRLQVGQALFTDNFSPPTAEPAGTETVAPSSEQVDLSNIPQSGDDQVDTIEIWRTAAGGSSFYKLTEVADGTTTYTDDIEDSDLESTELPTDNTVPYTFFTDHLAGFNGAMFWITSGESPYRGNLYYSPAGRLEAMDGFIRVTNDDEPLQKLAWYAGNLYVFSIDGLYIIHGTDPYYSRKVHGVPGTDAPNTVQVTPFGVAYKATDDTIRLFNGVAAESISRGLIESAITGEDTTYLSTFTGSLATHSKDEYIISNAGAIVLGYDLKRSKWRRIYVNAGNNTALARSPSTGGVFMGFASGAYMHTLETEDTKDTYANTSFIVETRHVRLGGDMGGIVKRLHIDYAFPNAVTTTLEADGSSVSLSALSTSNSRTRATLPVNRHVKEFGVKFSTNRDDANNPVLYGITADVYIPGEET